MKFALIRRCGFVPAQVYKISQAGYICQAAFLHADGSVGAFSEIDGQKWEGATFDSLEDCLKVPTPEIQAESNPDLLNYTHFDENLMAGVLNAQRDFELLQANLPAILKAICQGAMTEIFDQGNGWEWTATLLDIKVEGREVEYFSGGPSTVIYRGRAATFPPLGYFPPEHGGVAFYNRAENQDRKPQLFFKKSLLEPALAAAYPSEDLITWVGI